MSKNPNHPVGCECPECCTCGKCRARRDENPYDPAPQEPRDRAGASVRLLRGVTDPVERSVLIAVQLPGEKPATRANILAQVSELEAMRGVALDPGAAERALDALLAAGLLAEESRELRPTDLAWEAVKAGRGE